MVNGLSSQATLVFMLACAGVLAAGGIIADAAHVPDGVMCVAWVVGAVLYYQLMRRPGIVIRSIRALRPAAVRSVESA
jgi:hypothetical protein